MPFVGLKNDNIVTSDKIGVDFTKSDVIKCPKCKSEMNYRKPAKNEHGIKIRSGHFYHINKDVCSYGESEVHQKMKVDAISKLKDKYTTYSSITVEKKIGNHIADVVLEYNTDKPNKKGIVVEVQHKNKNKNILETTKDFIAHGYGVYWVFNTTDNHKSLFNAKEELEKNSQEELYIGNYNSDQIELGQEIYHNNFKSIPLNYCVECKKIVSTKKRFDDGKRCSNCDNKTFYDFPIILDSDYWTVSKDGGLVHKYLELSLSSFNLKQDNTNYTVYFTWVNNIRNEEKEFNLSYDRLINILINITNNIDDSYKPKKYASHLNNLVPLFEDMTKSEEKNKDNLYCPICSEYLPHYRGTPDQWLDNHISLAQSVGEHDCLNITNTKFDIQDYHLNLENMKIICPHCITEYSAKEGEKHLKKEHDYMNEEIREIFNRFIRFDYY